MGGRRTAHKRKAGAPHMNWRAYVAFAALTLVAFGLVQLELREPYMDEPFHIPQAQRYCKGDFATWDPKLTTPPGLYILSLVPITLLRIPCSISVLRAINLALLLAVPWLASVVLASFRPKASRRASTLPEATCIALFPPLWFFGHLYYTDVGSVALVLASWGASRKGHHLGASFLGLLSLTFRQTNIIWLAFIAGAAVLERCAEIAEIGKTVASGKGHLRREQKLAGDYDSLGSFLSHILELPRLVLANLPTLLPVIACYTPTFFAFLAFVLWNEGIVLGHQEYHGVSLHLPQVAYFFGFATAVGGVVLLDAGVKRVASRAYHDAFGGSRALIRTSALIGLTTVAVKHFTIAHPFLLADNRHYAFYFWRRVMNAHPFARYALGFGYVGCAILWGGRLLRTQPPLTLLLFLICTCATLIPTPLVEPRYFLTPWVILRILGSPTPSAPPLNAPKAGRAKTSGVDRRQRALALEAAWYVALNAVTLGVFLLVKFRWPGEDGLMRFMW